MIQYIRTDQKRTRIVFEEITAKGKDTRLQNEKQMQMIRDS